MSEDQNAAATIELTSLIVESYVANNRVAINDLPDLIKTIHSTLAEIGSGNAAAPAEPEFEKPTPAQIRRSIQDDGITSFVDGKKYKSMKRHLTTNGLTPPEYRERYGLPGDYPMVSPSYSRARSEMAKSMGLGQGGRGRPAPKGRAKK